LNRRRWPHLVLEHPQRKGFDGRCVVFAAQRLVLMKLRKSMDQFWGTVVKWHDEIGRHAWHVS
jgi:hypothetical protein